MGPREETEGEEGKVIRVNSIFKLKITRPLILRGSE